MEHGTAEDHPIYRAVKGSLTALPGMHNAGMYYTLSPLPSVHKYRYSTRLRTAVSSMYKMRIAEAQVEVQTSVQLAQQ